MLRAVLCIFGVALFVAEASGQTAAELKLVERAKAVLTRDFKDGASAKFRNVGLYEAKTGRGNDIVCGEVNAKNSFGAYVGFHRFAVWNDVVVVEKPDDPWRSTYGPGLCHRLLIPIPQQ